MEEKHKDLRIESVLSFCLAEKFTYIIIFSDGSLVDLDILSRRATCLESSLIGAKHIKFDKLQLITVLFVVGTFFLFFATDKSLLEFIKLV